MTAWDTQCSFYTSQKYFYCFFYLLVYHSVLHGILVPDRNLHLDEDINQACSYEEAVQNHDYLGCEEDEQNHDDLGHEDCNDDGDLLSLDGGGNYQLEENDPVGKDTQEEMVEKV